MRVFVRLKYLPVGIDKKYFGEIGEIINVHKSDCGFTRVVVCFLIDGKEINISPSYLEIKAN